MGCGPELEYAVPPGVTVIGLEASFESIKRNEQVAERIFGSATEIPLPSGSVDAVVAFYSVHHLTGESVEAHRRLAILTFHEMARVLKPGGSLLVFDIAPRRPFDRIERDVWPARRRVLGRKLDMFFWSTPTYRRFGELALPGAAFDVRVFRSPWWTTMPLSFSLPWAVAPRAIIPLDYCLFRWTTPLA